MFFILKNINFGGNPLSSVRFQCSFRASAPTNNKLQTKTLSLRVHPGTKKNLRGTSLGRMWRVLTRGNASFPARQKQFLQRNEISRFLLPNKWEIFDWSNPGVGWGSNRRTAVEADKKKQNCFVLILLGRWENNVKPAEFQIRKKSTDFLLIWISRWLRGMEIH